MLAPRKLPSVALLYLLWRWIADQHSNPHVVRSECRPEFFVERHAKVGQVPLREDDGATHGALTADRFEARLTTDASSNPVKMSLA
jgi:hypothetical protein